MKRCVKTLLALLVCLLMTVNVYADEAGKSQKPDIVTDYYMIVESPDGGIDIYAGAGFDYAKLNNEQIPNGTAFRIEGEKTDENNRVWGYTQYRGMYGYVPQDDLKPVTRSEAIDSEIYLAGADNVDYNADYDIESRDDAGKVYLYQGPGEKYGTISGNAEVADGEKLQVFEDANLADGSHWAQVRKEDGTEGWVNMSQMKPYGTADSDNSVVNMEVSKGSTEAASTGTAAAASDGTDDTEEADTQDGELLASAGSQLTPTPSVTVTPTPKPTSTPKPTASPTPTAEPTATEAPTPTAEPTATEAPTPTAEPTATEAPTPTAEPTAAEEATPTAEPTETEAAQEVTPTTADSAEASASQVTSTSSIVKSPFFWIIIVVIIAVIILLVYHFKKRDE